jgi:integrase
MFDDARRSKDLALRVREDNPARDVRGPDRGAVRASSFLFPRDIEQLAGHESIPQWRRRLYVFAVFLGCRAGELRALEWEDVHDSEEEGRFILVHQATDYDTGKVKSTKTGRARKVPIEPALLPLLEAMREESGGEGSVFARLPHKSELPWMLRLDLKEAGVKRAELFANDATRRQLDFHDLRHTYGTLRAIRKDSLTAISRAMGHSTTAMTERYVNEAEVFEGARFGTPFGPLPPSVVSKSRTNVLSSPKSAESLRPQGDSNPR